MPKLTRRGRNLRNAVLFALIAFASWYLATVPWMWWSPAAVPIR